VVFQAFAKFILLQSTGCGVVVEVAKPTGIGFDKLDGTVETFRTSVAGSVLTEVEQ
jgi:hypothetical protein